MSALPTSITDLSVLEFMTAWGLPAPVMLAYVNHGYSADWCHVSSKTHALKHGGKRVHGWALWDYPGAGVMGNFHSVWENPEGQLVDVTPPKFGASATMFVADPTLDIVLNEGVFEQPVNRMAIGPNRLLLDINTGAQTTFTHFGVSPSHPAFVAYCSKVGLAVADYPTDPVFG